MKNILLATALILISSNLFGQEICDNGIDDDNDGLIDLQDDDCTCDGTEVFFPTSLFPNPSFEDAICSPGASSVDCAEGWMQASAGTPDYIESCSKFSDVIPVPPCEIPSGDMCFGFIYSNITNLQVREYVGTCLTEPLQMGTPYKLNIWVGFLDQNGGDDLFVSEPMDLVVYGNDSCSSMPIMGTRDLCPLQAPNGEDWYEIGRIPVSGNDEWIQYSLDFTAERNFNAVILGPPCEVQTDTANYYFLDNIVLAEVDAFSDDIITVKSQNFETGELTLEVPDFPDVEYQWYKDEIALVGENGLELSLTPCEGDNGNYTVMVSNDNGCTISVPYVVDYEIPSINILGPSGLCPGEMNALSIADSFASIEWSTGHSDVLQIPIDAGGTYGVSVKNDVGCTSEASRDVSEYSRINVSADVQNESVPNATDGSITLSFTEMLDNPTYNWDDGATTRDIENLNEGLYCVTISADRKCDTVLCLTVGLDEIPFIFEIDKTDVSCNGFSDGQIEVSVSDGTPPFSFQWSTNAGGGTDPVVSNLPADIYSVTIVDAADVQRIAEVIIDEPDELTINAIKEDVSCFGGSDGQIEILSIDGGNGNNVLTWTPSGNGTNLNNISAGTYSVEVRDELNCTISETWMVEEPEPIDFSVEINDASCNGFSNGSARISNITGGNGNFIYLWDTGSDSDEINDVPAGTYAFTISDSRGCDASGEAIIGEPDPLLFEYESIDETCNGSSDGMLIVSNINGGTPDYDVLVDGILLEDDATMNGLIADIPYDVSVRDANGCLNSEAATVGRSFISSVRLPEDTMVIRDSRMIIRPETDEVIEAYNWSSNIEGTLLCNTCANGELTVVEPIVIKLETKNEFGCRAEDNMRIDVRDPYEVYWPNAFSPNNDGINDFFRPFNESVVRVIRNLQIFNKWGGVVFERQSLAADDPNLWWDGRIDSEDAHVNTFLYRAEVEFIDGTVINYSGQLTVMDN